MLIRVGIMLLLMVGEYLFFSSPVYASTESLMITEIMYNPEGSDTDGEWVEVYNSGDSPITIIGGTGAGSMRFYEGGFNRTLKNEAEMSDMVIGAEEYCIFARNKDEFLSQYPKFTGTVIEVSAMSLSNTGEKLALRIGSSGTEWGVVDYLSSWGGSGDGRSLELVDPKVRQTSESWRASINDGGSPGQKPDINSLPVVTEVEDGESDEDDQPTEVPVEKATIQALKSFPLSTKVSVSGIISVNCNALGDGSFYIQDSTGGILIRNSDRPCLAGEKVSIIGELRRWYGEQYIKFEKVVKTGVGEIQIKTVKTGDIGVATEGFIVQVRGTITKTSGDTFYLNDGSGEVRVIIKESTGITKPKMKKGDSFSIIGIVSQYNGVYRILPRIEEDIKKSGTVLGTESELPDTGANAGRIVFPLLILAGDILLKRIARLGYSKL